MSERRIDLNLGMHHRDGAYPDTHGEPEGSFQRQGRDTASLAQDAQKLRRWIEQRSSQYSALDPTTPQDTADSHCAVGSPMDLFAAGALNKFTSPQAPTHATTANAPPALEQALQHLAQRLLVSDGRHGQRAVQIELASSQLSGASLQVFEEAGALIAQFTCTREATREYLTEHALWLAQSLAQRLQRAVCLRVQTNDPHDPCLHQVNAP